MSVMQSYVAVYSKREIKGAAHKNGDVDGTCKRALTLSFTKHTNCQSTISSQPSLSVTSQVILSNQ